MLPRRREEGQNDSQNRFTERFLSLRFNRSEAASGGRWLEVSPSRESSSEGLGTRSIRPPEPGRRSRSRLRGCPTARACRARPAGDPLTPGSLSSGSSRCGRAMALEHFGELCHQRLDLLVVDAGFLTRYIPMTSRDREESLVNKVDEAIEIEPRKTDRRVDAPVGKVVVTQSRF
jgi:hypothetical protein